MPMHSRLYSFRVRGLPGGQENCPCPDCHLIVIKYLSTFYPTDDNPAVRGTEYRGH